MKENETEQSFVGRVFLCFLSHRVILFIFICDDMSLTFYTFDITANLCLQSKLNKEQQMLGYVSMCLYVKSPPLSVILDE